MKKIFLTALGVFAFAIMFSFQTENNNLVKNSAFADGTCCEERGSICGLNGENYRNKYLKSSGGSCGTTNELEMAP